MTMTPSHWLVVCLAGWLIYVSPTVVALLAGGPTLPPPANLLILALLSLATATAGGALGAERILARVDRRLSNAWQEWPTQPLPVVHVEATELDAYARGYVDGLARRPMGNVVPLPRSPYVPPNGGQPRPSNRG